jgi:hypothetical protein
VRHRRDPTPRRARPGQRDRTRGASSPPRPSAPGRAAPRAHREAGVCPASEEPARSRRRATSRIRTGSSGRATDRGPRPSPHDPAGDSAPSTRAIRRWSSRGGASAPPRGAVRRAARRERDRERRATSGCAWCASRSWPASSPFRAVSSRRSTASSASVAPDLPDLCRCPDHWRSRSAAVKRLMALLVKGRSISTPSRTSPIYEQTESISLAFVTALQVLPPR